MAPIAPTARRSREGRGAAMRTLLAAFAWVGLDDHHLATAPALEHQPVPQRDPTLALVVEHLAPRVRTEAEAVEPAAPRESVVERVGRAEQALHVGLAHADLHAADGARRVRYPKWSGGGRGATHGAAKGEH